MVGRHPHIWARLTETFSSSVYFCIPYLSGTLDFGQVQNTNTSSSKCNVLASKAV